MARKLIVLPRFKRDYRHARRHSEFEQETLEYVFDVLISGTKLPEVFNEHRLHKRRANWAGFTECHLGVDLLMIYRIHRGAVILHRIGDHQRLLGTPLLAGVAR